MDSFNIIQQNTIHRRIFELMEKGMKSKLNGWTLNGICQEIKNEYGSDGELLAKEFIIDKYQ